MKAGLDGGGGGDASKCVGEVREFGRAETECSYWPHEVKRHSSLVEVGSVDALESAGGSFDEVAPEAQRKEAGGNVSSRWQPGKALFRAVGAKVKGGALEIARGVGRDRRFELRRRLVRIVSAERRPDRG